MKRLAFVTLAFVLSACGEGASEPVRVRSGALALEARVLPAEPRVGENQLELALRDASGAPASGAHVSAEVRMRAMGAMPEMGGPARVRELGEGRYQADFGLAMGGTWQVQITAHAPSGETLQAEGSLTVGSPGLRLAAMGASAASTPTREARGESPGAFSFPAERLQQIGVRTVRAEVKPLARTIRATARVAFDERALADVSARVAGWAESVAVTAVGEPVARGEALLTLYSPDLYAAQREYQQALASRRRAEGEARAQSAEALVRAAERRLALLGIARADIAAIAKRAEPLEALPLRAPTSGFVIEKNVVAGGAVNAGERLYRIAPSEQVWLEAAIAESDLPHVREGAPVRAQLAGDTRAEPRTGRIARVLPQLAAESRTGAARIALDAPAALRPDAWASVSIEIAGGDGLAVPSSAVLRAGERSFVFIARGGGRFEPRAVTLGFETSDAIEIRSGLEAGEEIVSEGTYLIASESRLRAALEAW
jgi:Cu(I)/Ag(I) efflux system membrane fusion protein